MLGAPSAQHLPFGTNLAANGGPRAPGNCSILCDSRRGDMKELLNAQIKRREPFDDSYRRWLRRRYHNRLKRTTPTLSYASLQIRAEKESRQCGRDPCARLWSATDCDLRIPGYRRLIQAFFELIGVSMLLNTSFNGNEPVVCKPVEVLDFLPPH